MLVHLKEMVSQAADRDYAVPAFNVFGYEDAVAVVRAAEELNAPVILAANLSAVHHMPIPVLASILLEVARAASVPVCVHLDHGKDYDYISSAIKHGFTSVMFDGSQLPFEENVKLTKEIVKLGHAFGVSVEAEIGSVGYSDKTVKMKHEMSKTQEVAAFVEETGIDAVAISVGTFHRMEQQEAMISFELLQQIESKVRTPLVIHGATGVPNDQLRRLIAHRVGKINIGTALRMAFGHTLRNEIAGNPHEFDRLRWLQCAMRAVQEAAKEKLLLLGTQGRSEYV